MKAISLWQPWASLIALGAKPYETRSWSPPQALIGQRIAIHAALKEIQHATVGMHPDVRNAIDRALRLAGTHISELRRGVIVCTAVLEDAAQVNNFGGFVHSTGAAHLGPPDLFGDYSPGRWIWKLRDEQPLHRPVPWMGRQGFFDVPDSALGVGA